MADIYELAFDHARVGMFIVDIDQSILAWNSWMQEKTMIVKSKAVGVSLDKLYPDMKSPRFNWALDQVINNKSEQVMSYALNRYLIPIPVTVSNSSEVEMMPQQVYMSPITLDSGVTAAIILINDMTENVSRSESLIQVAYQLEEDSNRDSLTNIYNRRYLTEWLSQQAKLVDRYHFKISCLLFDLDFFKSINDDHGHDKGDEVLIEFSEYIASTLRETDIMVRYGGEEFVVMLSHTDINVARVIAERLRIEVQGLSVAGLPEGAITTSIGVACWNDLKNEDHSDLLKRADAALYKAKHHGRNCICIADEFI